MKCTYTIDVDADTSTLTAAEKSLLSFRPGAKGKNPIPYWKKGTTREFPDAYIHVQHGLALPADDECIKKVGLTKDELDALQKYYLRVSKGIHPDDFAAFDAGAITGYDAAGNYVPGPNWDAWNAARQPVKSDI